LFFEQRRPNKNKKNKMSSDMESVADSEMLWVRLENLAIRSPDELVNFYENN